MNSEGERIVAAARDLAPSIAAHASDYERARRLPVALIKELKQLGVFRLFVARRYGGYELELPLSLRLFEELSKADGSVGWNAVTWSHAAIYVAHLPKVTLDAIYGSGPDVVWTNSVIPAGTAEPVEGGYRISGRWPLVSGCEAADWMFAHCAVTGAEDSPRPVIAAAAPSSSWRINDGWRSMGLCGTGSLEIAMDGAFVPTSHVFDLSLGRPQLDGALYRSPRIMLPLHFSAVAIGIAQGAIEDLIALARTGHRRMSNADGLGNSKVSQTTLGWAEAQIRAARALMAKQADELWSLAEIEDLPSAAGVAVSEATAWIAHSCARAVDACFSLAGAAAIYQQSPLQRRLRDIRTLLQHRSVNVEHVTDAGARLFGLEAGDPMVV